MAIKRNIKARKRLEELYRKGVEVRFDNDGGHIGPFDEPATDDVVAMWVAPPNPQQRGMAMREAQAARARAVLATKRDEDSEEHLTAKVFMSEMSLDTLIEYLLAADGEKRQSEAIRDVLADPQWKDVSELQDAMRQYEEAGSPEDSPEWAPLLRRDAEYGDQVAARNEELIDSGRQSLRLLGREELEKRAVNHRAEIVGSQRFMEAYELWMSFYAVRDFDAREELFFESIAEWSVQEDDIRTTVGNALTVFITEGSEAKNSPGAAIGSDSSASPSEPETSEASTPEAATA